MNERPSHLFIFPLLPPPSCGVLFYTVLYSVIYNWNNKKAEGFFVVFLSLLITLIITYNRIIHHIEKCNGKKSDVVGSITIVLLISHCTVTKPHNNNQNILLLLLLLYSSSSFFFFYYSFFFFFFYKINYYFFFFLLLLSSFIFFFFLLFFFFSSSSISLS